MKSVKNRRIARAAYWPATSGRRALSKSRTAILRQLRGQPEPVTQSSLVAISGLHPNTVREHLVALLRRGLVSRAALPGPGRGRPAWQYQAVGDWAGYEHSRLAVALVHALRRSPSAAATEKAVAAGRSIARQMVAELDHRPTDPDEARTAVIALFDERGFAPEPDPEDHEVSLLTHCPLLETAHRHERLTCALHLGMLQGSLTELGLPATQAQLRPFAKPGACAMRVPATGGHDPAP